jgi:adenylate cyclase
MGTDERDPTFAFADMAGFTALTEAHGDERGAELAADFAELVDGLLIEGAEAVKTIGDAVMLRCDSAEDAIELGVRILERAGARDRFPALRVGMHTGSAVERDGDWFGTAVNVAARVSGAAGGGEVLLTDATRRAAGDLDDIELRRHGERRFRNLTEPIALFQAIRRGADGEHAPIDPVCRMAIARNHAAGTLSYQGRDYKFCSLACAAAFATSPESYVATE